MGCGMSEEVTQGGLFTTDEKRRGVARVIALIHSYLACNLTVFDAHGFFSLCSLNAGCSLSTMRAPHLIILKHLCSASAFFLLS